MFGRMKPKRGYKAKDINCMRCGHPIVQHMPDCVYVTCPCQSVDKPKIFGVT